MMSLVKSQAKRELVIRYKLLSHRPAPPLAAQPAGKATLGPVMERLVNDDGEGKDCLIDLDTGRLYSPPRHVKGRDKLGAWFREKGIDAGAETNPAGAGLWGLEMVVIPVASKLWDEDPLLGIRDDLERGKPGTPAVMSALGNLPRTYVFKTREGGIGVLQVLEVRNDVRPRHIKIRYKMLKPTRPRAPAPSRPSTQPAAKGDGVAWGKAVGGVQVGIGLFDPSKSSYRIGQRAGFSCHARNVLSLIHI